MFTLDSDIMGILMALLTFLIPLISALVERKRKTKKGGMNVLPDEEPVFEQQDPVQERLDEMEEMFNLILGKETEEEEEREQEIDVVQQEMPIEEIPVAGEGESTTKGDAAETVVEIGATQNEETRKRLKERLKDNPKDMVIFSEILNPKFKEY